MATREWLMSERNLANEPVDSLGDMSESERDNLALLVRQCRGWSSQDIEEVVAVMAEDGVYHDITLPPAVGHDAIRQFGAAGSTRCPTSRSTWRHFASRGNVVCDMGWMSGTITKDYFGLPGNDQQFDCQFSQICFVENGRIKYLRGLWNAPDMYNQVGWDLARAEALARTGGAGSRVRHGGG